MGNPIKPNKHTNRASGRSGTKRSPQPRNFMPPQSKSAMATGGNPSIEVGVAPDHPPPVTTYGEKWVQRTYQATQTATSTATGGVAFNANMFAIPGTFFIDKVQVWKLTQNSGPGITGFFYQNIATDLGGDTVVATDYGTATSLAGMTFKVPLGHAKSYTASVGGAIVDCNPAIVRPAPYSLDTYVCHLHCWVSI